LALERTAPGLSFQARAEIDKYLSAYAKDPRSRVFAALAEAYRRAGMREEAIKVAEEGLRYHPNLPSALVTLGRAYLDSGDPIKARPLLERVAQQSPDNLAAQRALAELYDQAGENELARQSYQAILQANPADSQAQTRLKQLPATSTPPPAPPAPAGPSPEPAGPPAPLGARMPSPEPVQEKTQAAPATAVPIIRPVASPPEPSLAPKPRSERDKMDLFFESVDVTRPVPPAPSQGYQVRSASEIFSDLEEEKKRSPITTETLARLLLKQGYQDKARVIFEEILAGDPSRQDLAQEVARLRQELSLPPFDLSASAPRREQPRAPAPPAPKGARVPSPSQQPPVPASTPARPVPLKALPVRPKAASRVPLVARASSPAQPPPPAPPKPTRASPRAPLDAPAPRRAQTPSSAQPPLGARQTPAAQPQQPAAARPVDPSKTAKIETLKGVLGQLKKGKKP